MRALGGRANDSLRSTSLSLRQLAEHRETNLPSLGVPAEPPGEADWQSGVAMGMHKICIPAKTFRALPYHGVVSRTIL